MSLTIGQFRAVAGATSFGSRDIAVARAWDPSGS